MVVHATMFVRTLLAVLRPLLRYCPCSRPVYTSSIQLLLRLAFTVSLLNTCCQHSSKFGKKIAFIPRLAGLQDHINITQLNLPVDVQL